MCLQLFPLELYVSWLLNFKSESYEILKLFFRFQWIFHLVLYHLVPSYCSFLGGFYFLFTCLYFIFTWHVSYFIYRVNPVFQMYRIACLIVKMKYRKHAISFKCTDMFLSKKKLSNKTNTTVVYTVYFIQLWFLQLMRIQQTRQERRGKENNINMNIMNN